MITKYSLMGMLSLSLLLISCSQQEVTTPKTSVTATPTPLIVTSPIPQPTASNSVASVSSTPTIYVTVKASSISPSASESIDDTYMRPNLKVIVVDETGHKLNGVKLRALSLNARTPYDSTIISNNGYYEFVNVPVYATIQVTANKDGYTPRVKTVVHLCSICYRIETIDINFGLDSDGNLEPNYALSDKPEVTSISPNFNTTEINPATSFTLKFSEPMDKNSVETNFVIRNRTDYIFSNSSSYGGRFKDVYDAKYYNASWNSANDEVTFTPKKGTYIPTDIDSTKRPRYYVTFRDVVKDSTGVSSRTLNTQADGITPFDIYKGDGPFRVTSVFKTGSIFDVYLDRTEPKIEKVSISDNTSISIQFSENMALYPLTVFKPFYDPNLTTPSTYTVKVDKNGDNYYSQDEIIGNPDQVSLDVNEGDSVKLSFPSLQNYKGKNIWIGISDGVNLYDPAGNAILNEKDRHSTITLM